MIINPRCCKYPALRIGAALLCGALLAGFVRSSVCGAPESRESGSPPDAIGADARFTKDILPLLQSKCIRCHGEKDRKADLDLRTLRGIRKGGESGPVIEPGKPDESLLYEKVHDGAMPPDKMDRLSKDQVDLIRRWIGAGAKGDAAGDGGEEDAPGPAALHDVLPILLRRCTVCHGASVREAGLDLRSRDAMLKGGKSGPAIDPGNPDGSLLVRKIRASEMPPIRRLIEVSIKPIEPAETDTIVRWIAAGAPEGDVRPDVAGTEPDPLVSDQDREFWSFRRPVAAAPPVVRHVDRAVSPVDAFILAKLEERGLALSPEADRATLLRRVTFDLIGLPPTPDEVRAFLADDDPRAYENLVVRLLASPRYGERWGRHWLDLAGYADSEGKREQDIPRPFAWRYRDYVIRALNADKPYDRFLLEQIAGDELADYEHAPEITQELYDNLVATGFLRMAPDPTWYNLTNFVPDRLEVIADQLDVLGSGVMGLTIKCARCHSHKFDPIPHRDYYRLAAVFKGAFDEHDWMKSNWHTGLSQGRRTDRELSYVTARERGEWQARVAALQGEIDALKASVDERAAMLTKQRLDDRLAKLPAELRDDLRAMLAAPAEKRSPVQAYLAEKFEKDLTIGRDELAKIDADFAKLSEESGRRIAELEGQKPLEPTIRALWDRGDPSPTYVYRRGDYLTPGRLVGPGVPSVLTDGRTPLDVRPPWPGAKQTGRRLALARWLTRPEHPLTARVFVNRVWKHHFGTGLVRTLDNFGKTGSVPSHPELLDYLAVEFMRSGWSVKALHRLLVTSAVYRQSSSAPIENVGKGTGETIDPENALLWRMPMQRLSADQLYDSLLAVAGRLDESPFGPPDPVDVRADGLATARGTPAGWRRSVYVQQQRKVVVTHLESFDFPAMNPNCVERRDSTVALQALHLWNDGTVQQLAEAFADRVRRNAGDEPERQVQEAYLTAFGRPPAAEETESGAGALGALAAQWLTPREGMPPLDRAEAARRALATYCHAIMNAAEFLYVD